MNTPTMSRAQLSPVQPAHTFRTITDTDWAHMLRWARAGGAAEGNELLARLRAKVRDAEAAPTTHTDLNSTSLHE